MTEQMLTLLKFCLLALLYLFFFRVLKAVWTEVHPPRTVEAAAGPGPVPPAAPAEGRRRGRRVPTQLTLVEPADQRGRVWPLTPEMTVGRAAGCHVSIEDTFSSQIHARLFTSDGQVWVEDLGSTNGTFVNRSRITTTTAVRRGDLLQIGNTVLELG